MKKRAIIYIWLIVCCISLSSFNFLSKETLSGSSFSNNTINSNTYQQQWFINSIHNLIFETPNLLIDRGLKTTQGMNDYISKCNTYSCIGGKIALNYLIMETRSSQYNTQKGLQNAITNEINNMRGENLKLIFRKGSNPKSLYSDGTFNFENHKVLVKGYCLFKNKKIFIIIAYGDDKTESRITLNRIFASIKDSNAK